eukprot:PhF_6_TR25676/c2_g1_i1/m.36176
MTSLLSSIVTSPSFMTPGILIVPRDCIQRIMDFTDTRTTLLMFLVCRSWYHAVDRTIWLGDTTYYHLPEMYRDAILRCRKIPACVSTSSSSLQDDVRWGYVDVMVLTIQDILQGFECFPSSLKSLCLHESDRYRITDAGLEHISKLMLLTSLDLTYGNLITDVGLA